MIRILGLKRIILLGLLVVLNVLLAAAVYLYMNPQEVKKQRELQGVQGEIATLSDDISRMQIEFDDIERQKSRFQELVNDGFFRDQSRREAEELIRRIQVSSNVVTASASIASGEVVDDEEAAKAGYKILKSPVSLTIEALDDVDVYRYLYMVQRYFPGYITYEKLTMERMAAVDASVLRALASGATVPLVKASINMTWQTMIPDPNASTDGTLPEGLPQ